MTANQVAIADQASSRPRQAIIDQVNADLSRRPTNNEIARVVGVLLASYPQHGPGEPDQARVYVTQLRTLLADYPLSVGQEITNPITGVVARSVWLPSVAEVKAACDAALARKLNTRDRAAAELRQIEERAAPPPRTQAELDAASERVRAFKSQIGPVASTPPRGPR